MTLRRYVNSITTSTVLTALIFLGAHGTHADALTEAVEARQEGFKVMGRSMKALKKALKTMQPGEPSIVAASQAIADNAQHIAEWFPAGSGYDDGMDTDALDYIWENPEKFNGATTAMMTTADALLQASKNGDAGQFKQAFMATKDACSDCHRSFRAD